MFIKKNIILFALKTLIQNESDIALSFLRMALSKKIRKSYFI
jgi:hypothetical protein